MHNCWARWAAGTSRSRQIKNLSICRWKSLRKRTNQRSRGIEMGIAKRTQLIAEKAIIMSGYGINSEMETQEALKRAGMASDIVHINDLIDNRKKLSDYRLAIFPGGFSYGDDTGAGNAYANRIRNNLWDELQTFLDRDNLVLGICNGFQILVNLGLLPSFGRKHAREIALMPNRTGVLECRYVTLKPAAENLWTKGIERICCPIAHGEGNFYCASDVLRRIKAKNMIC